MAATDASPDEVLTPADLLLRNPDEIPLLEFVQFLPLRRGADVKSLLQFYSRHRFGKLCGESSCYDHIAPQVADAFATGQLPGYEQHSSVWCATAKSRGNHPSFHHQQQQQEHDRLLEAAELQSKAYLKQFLATIATAQRVLNEFRRLWGHTCLRRQHDPYKRFPVNIHLAESLRSPNMIRVVPYPVVTGHQAAARGVPVSSLSRHCKMGGVWMDLPGEAIEALIFHLSGVRVARLDMFHRSKGRCALLLRQPKEDFDRLRSVLHLRMWMGPQVALLAQCDVAAHSLDSYLAHLRRHRPPAHYPRHLVTVEHWINQFDVHANAAPSPVDTSHDVPIPSQATSTSD